LSPADAAPQNSVTFPLSELPNGLPGTVENWQAYLGRFPTDYTPTAPNGSVGPSTYSTATDYLNSEAEGQSGQATFSNRGPFLGAGSPVSQNINDSSYFGNDDNLGSGNVGAGIGAISPGLFLPSPTELAAPMTRFGVTPGVAGLGAPPWLGSPGMAPAGVALLPSAHSIQFFTGLTPPIFAPAPGPTDRSRLPAALASRPPIFANLQG